VESHPAVQPGQLSPDGRWRWDGLRWAPTAAGTSPATAKRRRLMIWWLTSTSTLLVVLVAVLAVWVYQQIPFERAGLGCLPADFPIYPKMTVLEIDQQFEMPMQGDTKTCRMRLSSSAPFGSVNSFYRQRLNSGDWMYTSYSEDSGGSITIFQLRSRPLTSGLITVLNQPAGTTTLDIRLYS
jgi:hypothetical protein